MSYVYYHKDESGKIIELYFEKIPSSSVRQKLKWNGWCWNPEKMCWWTLYSKEDEYFAQELGAFEAYKEQKKTVQDKQQQPTLCKEMEKCFTELGVDSKNRKEMENVLPTLSAPSPAAIRLPQIYEENKGRAVFLLISEDGKVKTIGVVKNVEDQDTSKGIYWVERTISNKIIQGYLNNKPWFFFRERLYLIRGYAKTTYLQEIEKHTRHFTDRDEIADVWVYKLKMPCSAHPYAVEMVTAYIPVEGVAHPCQISVYYCSVCRKYYINAEQYSDFAQRYGLPMIRLRYEEGDTFADYSSWNEESILHIMGYNVSAKDNLPEEERRRVLLHAINTGSMSKAEVVSFLEFFDL